MEIRTSISNVLRSDRSDIVYTLIEFNAIVISKETDRPTNQFFI